MNFCTFESRRIEWCWSWRNPYPRAPCTIDGAAAVTWLQCDVPPTLFTLIRVSYPVRVPQLFSRTHLVVGRLWIAPSRRPLFRLVPSTSALEPSNCSVIICGWRHGIQCCVPRKPNVTFQHYHVRHLPGLTVLQSLQFYFQRYPNGPAKIKIL